MEFRSIHTIETGESVHLKVELAGLASRVFAFGIDGMLMLTLMGAVLAFFSVLAATQGSPEIAGTMIPLGIFIVSFGYHLFQEWLWGGKTIGKSIFNIRVVRNNGQPIGFWESFGRNLLRVLDVYTFGIGLLCMMFNRDEKRFGDFVAGTIVVNEQPVLKPGGLRYDADPAPALPEDESLASTIRLTDEEAELLKAYRVRRGKLLLQSRTTLAKALYRYFSERWHQPVASDADLDAGLEQYRQSLLQQG